MKTSNYKKNLTIYTLIISSNLFWFFLGLGKAGNSLLNLDQKIMLLTSTKMNYFNLNAFEAAWNHHTSPIFYIFKLTFLISEYLNIEFGFYVLYSFLLLLINFVLFQICYKLTKNKYLSFVLAACFIFDLSSATVSDYILFDNRTIGILFQCIILNYSLKIIENENRYYVFIFSIASFFQIVFLESYIISCGLIFFYLLSTYDNKYELCKIFFSTNITLLTLFIGFLYLNSELIETLNINYVFHIDAIGFNSIQKIEFAYLLNYGLFKSWGINKIFHIMTILFMILFFYRKKIIIKNVLIEKYYGFINFYFLAEILHLFITGPRFVNYLQIILLFQYLIIFISIFFIQKYFRLRLNLINLLTTLFLIILFLVMQFDYVVNKRTSLLDNSYLEANKLNTPTEEVSKYLYEDGKPELILAWISVDSWENIYFKTNKLPSTRMWWWFHMKYIENIYSWTEGRYYNSNLEEIFLNDLSYEKPKYAIIERGVPSPPNFYNKYIETNFSFITEIENYLIYKYKN